MTPARSERIAGAMYGAAIGDALGSAFEFVDSAGIEAACGEPAVREYRAAVRGSLLYPREPGNPTDDTAMALSVAATVAASSDPQAEDFARGFVADLRRPDGRFATMFWTGGPGGATTRALARLTRGANAADCGAPDDGGNGAAMRAHPTGFLPGRERALRAAGAQARTTHGHPAAVAAAQAVAALVFDALDGASPSTSIPDGVDDPTFARAWRSLHDDLTVRERRLPAALRNVAMSGWETVAAAHAIVCCFPEDPNAAIAAAAASGGDTDTIASIAGAIAGARHGIQALEPRWRARLVPRGLVDAAIARLQ